MINSPFKLVLSFWFIAILSQLADAQVEPNVIVRNPNSVPIDVREARGGIELKALATLQADQDMQLGAMTAGNQLRFYFDETFLGEATVQAQYNYQDIQYFTIPRISNPRFRFTGKTFLLKIVNANPVPADIYVQDVYGRQEHLTQLPANQWVEFKPDQFSLVIASIQQQTFAQYRVGGVNPQTFHIPSWQQQDNIARLRQAQELERQRLEQKRIAELEWERIVEQERIDNLRLAQERHRRINATTIRFPGNNQQVTVGQLKNQLANRGLTMVQTDKLGHNECALIYGRANRYDTSGEFGLLTCAYTVGDRVTFNTAAIYGGCDASNPLTQGVGAACEVGVFSNNVTVALEGGETSFAVKGPSASACGSVSSERLCLSAGATLASASYTITDDAGTGIGFTVEKGVGYGINGGYEGGVLYTSLNLKFIAGGSITMSINPRDVAEKIYNVGDQGYILANKVVVGAAIPVANRFNREINRSAVVVGKGIITAASVSGRGIIQVANITANGTVEALNVTGNGVIAVSNEIGNGVVQTVNEIEKLGKNVFNAIGL